MEKNQVDFFNQGPDTASLVIETPYTRDTILSLRSEHPMLKSIIKVQINKFGNIKLVFQVSKFVDNTRLVNDVELFIEYVEKCLKILKAKVLHLERIDIALDSRNKLNNYKKLARLIVLCVAQKKRIRTAFRVENLTDLEEKTVKLRSDKFEMTFYSREDRGIHSAKSRLEMRYKREVEEKWKSQIRNRIKESTGLFTRLNIELKTVERIIVRALSEEYKTFIEEGIIRSFTDYIVKREGFIYTKTIFDELYKISGLKGNSNNWLKDHRSTRKGALNFISFRDVNDFSSKAKAKLKQLKSNPSP
ncbi:hypothetical protein NRK67_16855 (plasmid) [Fusobacteria bacterium ZRK30]|nr:hypothetical protein NRK67_16855 [Fusobacteria bacterium ZRK30]